MSKTIRAPLALGGRPCLGVGAAQLASAATVVVAFTREAEFLPPPISDTRERMAKSPSSLTGSTSRPPERASEAKAAEYWADGGPDADVGFDDLVRDRQPTIHADRVRR